MSPYKRLTLYIKDSDLKLTSLEVRFVSKHFHHTVLTSLGGELMKLISPELPHLISYQKAHKLHHTRKEPSCSLTSTVIMEIMSIMCS